jgi:hypothetical protein
VEHYKHRRGKIFGQRRHQPLQGLNPAYRTADHNDIALCHRPHLSLLFRMPASFFLMLYFPDGVSLRLPRLARIASDIE